MAAASEIKAKKNGDKNSTILLPHAAYLFLRTTRWTPWMDFCDMYGDSKSCSFLKTVQEGTDKIRISTENIFICIKNT